MITTERLKEFHKSITKLRTPIMGRDGVIKSFREENRFLYNFYECPIEIYGIVYNHSEGAFQAMKTLDPEERLKFVDMTPTAAKRSGRKVKLRED